MYSGLRLRVWGLGFRVLYSALGFEVEGLGFGCWGFGFGAHVGTKDLVIRAIGFVIKAWAKGRYEGLLRTVTLRVHVRFMCLTITYSPKH